MCGFGKKKRKEEANSKLVKPSFCRCQFSGRQSDKSTSFWFTATDVKADLKARGQNVVHVTEPVKIKHKLFSQKLWRFFYFIFPVVASQLFWSRLQRPTSKEGQPHGWEKARNLSQKKNQPADMQDPLDVHTGRKQVNTATAITPCSVSQAAHFRTPLARLCGVQEANSATKGLKLRKKKRTRLVRRRNMHISLGSLWISHLITNSHGKMFESDITASLS